MKLEVGELKRRRIGLALFVGFGVGLSACAAGCGGGSATRKTANRVPPTASDQLNASQSLGAWIHAHPSLRVADYSADEAAYDRTPLDRQAFVERARLICRAANMDAEAMHRVAQTLAGGVAVVDVSAAIAETQDSRLSGLQPPAEDRSKVKQLLRTYSKQLDLAQRLTNGLLGGDPAGVRHTMRRLDAASRAGAREARKLGLGECARETGPQQAAPSPSDSLTQIGQLRMGGWTASATSLRATGFADEHAGDRWSRRWYFSSDCQLGYCVTVLTRQTSSGVVSGRVRSNGENRYFIESDLPIKCDHHTSGAISSTFNLVFDDKSGTLTGTEDEDITDPACGPAVAVHRWTARPITRGTPS